MGNRRIQSKYDKLNHNRRQLNQSHDNKDNRIGQGIKMCDVLDTK